MESAGSSKRVHFAECSQSGMYTVYLIRSYKKRSYIIRKTSEIFGFLKKRFGYPPDL